MRVAARLLGVPVAVAAVATAATWASAATGTPTSSAKPATTTSAKARPGRPAGSGLPRRSIAGTWEIANGIFEFRQSGDTYTDVVISQRPGVFCPKINDQNGQIVLRHSHGGVYTGTWMWYYEGSCKFAGFGRLTVTLYWTGDHGIFVADPPTGLPGGTSHTFMMERV